MGFHAAGDADQLLHGAYAAFGGDGVVAQVMLHDFTYLRSHVLGAMLLLIAFESHRLLSHDFRGTKHNSRLLDSLSFLLVLLQAVKLC